MDWQRLGRVGQRPGGWGMVIENWGREGFGAENEIGVGAGGMGRVGRCRQCGLCEYIQWDGTWRLKKRSDSSLLNRHALVGRGSLVPPVQSIRPNQNVPTRDVSLKSL